MPTEQRNIFVHTDKAGRRCEASGKPYSVAEVEGDSAEVLSAKELLKRSGYVLLKQKSWRNAQREHAIARSELEWEKRESARTREWAQHDLCGEIRRLRDRVTFLYGVARARGASVTELSGVQLAEDIA